MTAPHSPDTAEALVEVVGLSTGYGRGEPALQEVSFSIRAGQSVAVLGPNGGGKTTLFRALLGELPARSGTVRVGPRASYVPQAERSRLDFPVRALDVAMMGRYGSTPWYRPIGRDGRRAALAALDRVGLADRAPAPYGALSGGQRRRVLIARALAQDSRVLLLDEPLSGVDHTSAERIFAVLEELRDEGRAVLVATHDLREAGRFDRVLCLNRRQVAFGSPDEALAAPVLERTFGGEIVVLRDGERAVATQHHAH